MAAQLLSRIRPTISGQRALNKTAIIRQSDRGCSFNKHRQASPLCRPILWAAALISLSSLPACGATLYVSTTGDDASPGTSAELAWRTIAHAAKTAQAGDLVRIKGGDYAFEQVVVANSGTPEARVRFEGYDGEVVLEGKMEKVEGKIKLKGLGVDIKGKSYVTLSGITARQYGTGIFVRDGSHHVTVERCTAGVAGWAGIAVTGSHHCEVRHCTAYNAEMCNFWVGRNGGSDSHDNVVADCYSYCDPRLEPYTDYCYSFTNARNVLVTRCRGDGKLCTGHGICFTRGGLTASAKDYGCENCRVTDCEMRGCWELFGARHGCRDITFVDCYGESKIMDKSAAKGKDVPAWCKHVSYDWYSHGFYFRTGVQNIRVKNCRVRGVMNGLNVENGQRFVEEEGWTGNVTFENCIAVECINGISLKGPDIKVLNCISARNKRGITIFKTAADGLSTKDCIIYQNATGIRSEIPTTTAITHCNIRDNQTDFSGKASTGEKCISEDPQFVTLKRVLLGTPRMYAPTGVPAQDWDDWHLQETSPCKDMGPYADDPEASVGMR